MDTRMAERPDLAGPATMKHGTPDARSGPSAASVSPPTPTRPQRGPADAGLSSHACP